MHKHITILTIIIFLCIPISNSYSQKLIVHKFNREDVNIDTIKQILLLKKTYWCNSKPIQIYFLDNYLKMNQLTTNILGISYSQYDEMMHRLVSEGLAKPPIILPHSVCVIQAVQSNILSLGVIDEMIILSNLNLVKFIYIHDYLE